MCQLVDGEQYGDIALAQNVAENDFVVLLGKVLIEKQFCLIVFVKLERNRCIP